jgi:hypothetical protein
MVLLLGIILWLQERKYSLFKTIPEWTGVLIIKQILPADLDAFTSLELAISAIVLPLEPQSSSDQGKTTRPLGCFIRPILICMID